ncbi:hypothetical protein [Calidifontibacter terrae]
MGDRANGENGASFSFKDGDESTDHNSFRVAFETVAPIDRASIVKFFARTVELWAPERGGIFSLQATRHAKGRTPWYPPIGVVNYFANTAGYKLPTAEKVCISDVGDGQMAVLDDWSFNSIVTYDGAFVAENIGISSVSRDR